MASRQSNSDQLETILYRLDEIEKKIDRMGNVETRIALLEKEQIVQGIEIKGLVVIGGGSWSTDPSGGKLQFLRYDLANFGLGASRNIMATGFYEF